MTDPVFRNPDAGLAAGMRSTNYAGSFDDYLWRNSRVLAEAYMRGELPPGSLTMDMSPIGEASTGDWASGQVLGDGKNGGTGRITEQTYQFFYNYLKAYGSQDPYLIQRFGEPPTRMATWEDPNVVTQGTFAQKSAENALDRTTQQNIANTYAGASVQSAQISADASRYGADQQLAGVTLSVNNAWRTAQLDDATRRYIAEGDWGVQKFIVQAQESGAMDRLKLELGQRDKELAQAAIGERDRHHEAMVGLVLEVAKYDSQLAGQPRNWVAYAAWLQNRGMVVNGLNLGAVAQMLPETSLNPMEIANSANAQGAAIAAVQTAEAAASAQASGGQQSSSAGTQQQTAATTTGGQGQQQQEAAAGGYTVAGVNLDSTDYTGMANQLLGIGGGGGTAPTTEQLQQTYDSIQGQGRQPNFGAWGGPTTNSLGMVINPNGAKRDFRRWSSLLPSQQEMDLGAVASVGKYEPDFVQEMQASRPKGATRGAAAYG
jgi:hypothetical protein